MSKLSARYARVFNHYWEINMDNIALIDGYNMRLDDEIDSGLLEHAGSILRNSVLCHLPDIDELPPEGAIVDAWCFTGSKPNLYSEDMRGEAFFESI